MIRTNRVTETYRQPDRGPALITGASMLLLLAAFACGVKNDKTTKAVVAVDSGTIAQPIPPKVEGTVATIPENVSFATAESAYTSKKYREAADMFGVYVQRKPENAWGHYMLGLSAWKSGDLERARGAFEKSIELDPKHVKSLLNLTRVLLEQGQPKLALEKVTTAQEIDSSSSEVYRLMGRVQTALSEPDSAIESYQVALTLDTTDVWSMNNMGLILIQHERFDEALPPLARAVQLRPGSPVFQNNLGIALEHGGHFVAAAEAYRAAIAADGGYAKASVSLARVDGLSDDPNSEPVELAFLAEEFGRALEGWRQARAVSVKTVVKPEGVPR
jgi:tetratricopeptide (TPR) repeat protein